MSLDTDWEESLPMEKKKKKNQIKYPVSWQEKWNHYTLNFFWKTNILSTAAYYLLGTCFIIYKIMWPWL